MLCASRPHLLEFCTGTSGGIMSCYLGCLVVYPGHPWHCHRPHRIIRGMNPVYTTNAFMQAFSAGIPGPSVGWVSRHGGNSTKNELPPIKLSEFPGVLMLCVQLRMHTERSLLGHCTGDSAKRLDACPQLSNVVGSRRVAYCGVYAAEGAKCFSFSEGMSLSSCPTKVA